MSSSGGESRRVDLSHIKPRPKPDFSKPIVAPWSIEITESDLAKLIKGFFPPDMDGKWAIKTSGPDEHGIYTTSLVRSWTGRPIIVVKVKAVLEEDGSLKAGSAAELSEVAWETDREVFRPEDDFTETIAKTWIRDAFKALLEVELPA